MKTIVYLYLSLKPTCKIWPRKKHTTSDLNVVVQLTDVMKMVA